MAKRCNRELRPRALDPELKYQRARLRNKHRRIDNRRFPDFDALKDEAERCFGPLDDKEKRLALEMPLFHEHLMSEVLKRWAYKSTHDFIMGLRAYLPELSHEQLWCLFNTWNAVKHRPVFVTDMMKDSRGKSVAVHQSFEPSKVRTYVRHRYRDMEAAQKPGKSANDNREELCSAWRTVQEQGAV